SARCARRFAALAIQHAAPPQRHLACDHLTDLGATHCRALRAEQPGRECPEADRCQDPPTRDCRHPCPSVPEALRARGARGGYAPGGTVLWGASYALVLYSRTRSTGVY